MSQTEAMLFAVVTVVNLASVVINIKLYTEILKEKSQRGRARD